MAKFANVNIDAALTNGAAGSLFYLKETLKSAGWTVLTSSDGLTYKNNGDQIESPNGGAKGMGNNFAWFRIADPGGLREYVFQRSTSGDQWRVKYSASAKFISAPITAAGPTATITPSASDEQFLIGSGTDTSPSSSPSLAPMGTNFYTHCVAESVPEGNGYGFWCFTTTKTTGAISGIAMTEPLAVGSYPSADTEPLLHAFYAGDPSTLYTTFRGFYAKGLPAQAWLTNWKIKGTYDVAGNAVYGSGFVGANPYTGNDDMIPGSASRYSAGTQPGWKGYTKFIMLRGMSRAYPNTVSLATDARVYAGEFLLPWPNGVVPVL